MDSIMMKVQRCSCWQVTTVVMPCHRPSCVQHIGSNAQYFTEF